VSSKIIKISIVNYTNTLPFKWALKRSELMQQIDLQEDIPTICAQKLKFGQVDLALVPVALLPELDHYNIVSDYCIGANGKVDSVKLYSKVPITEIETVVLDYQSKSSITLTQVLFQYFWKRNVKFIDAKPGFEKEVNGKNAAVVIGDRTFSLNGTFKFEYDLAEEWKKFTGLPFVFAAWVSTEKINEYFINVFNRTLKFGIQNIETALIESEATGALNKSEMHEYLTSRINYLLDKEKKEALTLFLTYISKLHKQ
jgi:chorismate dehydratase